MKNIKESIKTPLIHICNKSFSSGLFPPELKIANVVTIFKSGDEMVFSNYRPVSVLPVFTSQPLRAPGYCRHPSGQAGGRADKPC